ncbi:MAG: hypothetical protein KJ646_02545 [Nanoarchaeota archaeon]|nr:hypothetical protein [Nanoarchaeota archaeon]MBU4116306.1 hypothetical protein [Nanoarchaeota archaeon]
MENKPLMYFGHPINFYNTKKEKKLIIAIQEKFPEYYIENPNQLIHKDNYIKWKERTGNGMNYYFKIVLPKMEGGTFLCFEDGMFGAGVFGEAEFLKDSGKLIYEINLEEKIKEMILDSSRTLSIKETKKRVYSF